MTHTAGRALVGTYYSIGPRLADTIREHATLRTLVRGVLTPVVGLLAWLEE